MEKNPFKDKKKPCTECGDSYIPAGMVKNENGDHFCEDCYNEQYYHCESCHTECKSDHIHSDESGNAYCGDCYNEYYTRCYDCDNEVSREYAFYDDNSGENYCEDCYRESDVSLESFQGIHYVITDSDTFRENPFKRLASTEIETILGGETSFNDVEDGMPSQWILDNDGSISGNGAEFYLRGPQNGDKLYKSIDDLCESLRNWDCSINRSCGLHVHIDARDLFYKELKGMLLVGKKAEKFIYSMLPPSRETSNWCKRLPMSVESILRINSDSDFIDLWYDSCEASRSMDKYNEARYHGMNMHARVYLGSVEFRYHSGTNNPIKIKNWMYVCQSITRTGIILGKALCKDKSALTPFEKRLIDVYTKPHDNEYTYKDFIETLELPSEVSGYVDMRRELFKEHYIVSQSL